MSKKRNPLALGITVIVMFALFFSVLMYVAKVDFRPKDRFVVRFTERETLPEIKEGGLVQCGPTIVGKITGVEVREGTDESVSPPAPQLYFYISATVDREIGLREDCTIVPEGPLLGGSGKLIIRDRGVSANPVRPDKVIIGQQVGSFSAITEALYAQLDATRPDSLLSTLKVQLDPANAASLMAKVHKSMDDLNLVTTNISTQFDARQKDALMAKLQSILDNINVATGYLKAQLDAGHGDALAAKLHVGLDELDKGLKTVVAMLEENRVPLAETVASVRNTAKTLETRIAEQIARQLDTDNAASLIAKIHVGIDRLNTSLTDVNTMTQTGREVFVLNEDKLNKLLANLKETSDHLKGAAKDIRRNPWRLLYRPTLEETKQLDIFDASRAFAEAATQLDDAVTQLKALEQSKGGAISSDDPQLVQIRQRLAEVFEKFSGAEGALWKQLNIGD
jgi:hypothetical protein